MRGYLKNHPARCLAILAIPLMFAVSGCSVVRSAIRSDFPGFNQTIQFNQEQQMLLNLVRLRYCEAPLFMQVGALAASYTGFAEANASFLLDPSSLISQAFGLTGRFATNPTITYTPIEGAALVQQVMSEVKLETLQFLVRSGWPADKVCNLLVERITLDNASPLINSPGAPTYPQFLSTVQSLRKAQDRYQLEVLSHNGKTVVRADDQIIPIDSLQLRSLMTVMYDVAAGVEVPDGQQDWVVHEQPNKEMNIKVSAFAPMDGFVWVKYMGHYFSIANNDVRSKQTLALLMHLFRMQSGEAKTGPILTLPVTR